MKVPGGEVTLIDISWLVYGGDSLRPLYRWAPSASLVVTLEGTLAAHAAVPDRIDEARVEVERTTGMPMRIGSNGNIVMIAAPNDPFFSGGEWAYTKLEVSGGTITRARIVFRDADVAASLGGQNTLLHEVGHAIGLGDSAFYYDVMYPTHATDASRKFLTRETVILKMMYRERNAGNLYPDRDPATP
jgi:hypothetical protein